MISEEPAEPPRDDRDGVSALVRALRDHFGEDAIRVAERQYAAAEIEARPVWKEIIAILRAEARRPRPE